MVSYKPYLFNTIALFTVYTDIEIYCVIVTILTKSRRASRLSIRTAFQAAAAIFHAF